MQLYMFCLLALLAPARLDNCNKHLGTIFQLDRCQFYILSLLITHKAQKDTDQKRAYKSRRLRLKCDKNNKKATLRWVIF